SLGILVQAFHVRVGRGAVEVEVVLLHVLAVVALAVGQPEQPLFQDRILPVPQRQGEAEPLLVVGDARQAVLAPAVGSGARVVVREIVPGITVLAVVLPHGPPLPLAEVRPPPSPRPSELPRLVKSVMLCRHINPSLPQEVCGSADQSYRMTCPMRTAPAG